LAIVRIVTEIGKDLSSLLTRTLCKCAPFVCGRNC